MKNSCIFSGHAQLPAGTDIYENHKYLTIVLEVDMNNGVILNCTIPTYCTENSEFVADLARGRKLDSDMESIIAEIEERMHVLSKWALITAIKGAQNRFLTVRNSKSANQEQCERIE